jgi:ATP-binding cassette subfamily F protein 3
VPSPSAPPAASARDERAAARPARAKRAEQTRPLRVELDRIEQRLARLGQEKSEWEAMLCQADLPRDTWVDAGRQLNHIAAETETLEARWLELQATLETFHPPLEAS